MAEIPHLWNLNEDPALTAKIIHFVRQGKKKFFQLTSFDFSHESYDKGK